MTRNLFRTLSWCFALSAVLLAASCSNDKPTDETLHKLHGDPVAATLTLEAGTVSNGLFTPNASLPAGTLAKARQSVTFRMTSAGWGPTSGDTALYVLQNQAYRLSIRYTDAKGKDITYQFATNGQDKIHQHFFRARRVEGILGETATANEIALSQGKVATDVFTRDVFEYHYADTTPWDAEQDASGSNVTGEHPTTGALVNPIGFKGWMRFLTGERYLHLKIDLMHARISKYINSVCSPYYQPRPGQRSGDHWDLHMSIPVLVFSSTAKEAAYLQSKQ